MKNQVKNIPKQMLPRGFVGYISGWIMPIFHSTIYKRVYPVLDLKPEDDLLEVGCGSGYFLKNYASYVKSIAGIDLSDVMIKIATRKNRDRILEGTAEFIKGDASGLPWDNNRFSAVTSMGSFIGFPRQLESLKEMHRVLRPAGRAVVSIEWNAEDGVDHSKKIEKWGMKILSEDDVRSMMKEAGFKDISFAYFKDFGTPYMMIVRGIK